MTPARGDAGLLAGKTVMVTGASSGIGAAAATIFAAEGASVVLMARRKERLRALCAEITMAGGRASAVVGDVTLPEDVERAVEVATEDFSGLDAAFNNAGEGALGPLLHEVEQSVFDRIMNVNVGGVWNCLRSQIRAMLEQKRGGAIVNTSSTAGLFATGAAAPYVASKHAVLGLTKTAAAEYGDRGIRVNALVVGGTRTEMMDKVLRGTPQLEGPLVSRAIQQRLAEPEEIARTAAWLCSDQASFITGGVIPVDGGCTAV